MSNQNPSQQAVISSVQALINAYATANSLTNQSSKVEEIILNENADFLTRIDLLDGFIEQNNKFEPLSELLFDLLMVHFLAAEQHKEDYFDSQEWNDIENKTLDRGTEMLNLFLYISEANESQVEISLDDFLNEFLLVGEDEFEDEYRIYESLIVNEDILDADINEIRSIQKNMKEDTGLQDFFVPIVLFFQISEEIISEESALNGLNPFELAALEAMLAFNI